MFQRILVAYDGSRGAEAALRMGIDLAKALGAELGSVSVEERLPRYAATVGEVEEAKAQIDEYFHKLTKEARDLALQAGVELETVVRPGHEAETILSAAREGRFDLLLIGYHGHSRVYERIIGSTAQSVARLASCSVLLARPRGPSGDGLAGVKRILVGLDGSPLGRLAFQAALSFAALCRGSVIGMTVREVSPHARPEAVDWSGVQQLQRAAAEHASAAGVPFEGVTRTGHAAQTLSDHARESGADLIVLGATGLEHPWSPTIGGTATRVAGEAPCSVLLVRPKPAVLHVRDVMVRGVSAAMEDTPLTEVVELLLRRNVKAIPVIDARRHVVGIITGGDLLRRGDLELRLSIQQELDPDMLRDRLAALAQSRKTARDVMTHPVHTVEADADLVAAIRLMAAQRVKRLPVVDRRWELTGVVSRADLLRAIAALPEEAAQVEGRAPTLARTVGDALTTGVPVVPPDALAEDVLVKLLESPLRRVVVVGTDGRVLGIISDRDLLVRSSPDTRPWLLRALTGRRRAERPREEGPTPAGPPGRLTARELMAPSLVTVRPEDSLAHAIRLMMQHQVKRLVVVDEAGRLRGLIDRREILRALAA
jgi:nucleotide-binding universal stress UspA family protein/CBS-domain-containing membrane protein